MERNNYSSRVLAVIITYNGMAWIKRCLNSLITSSLIPDIFVVDNGSNDGTQLYIQENYPQIHFTQNKTNLGFGKANNIGLQYALDHGYDYVYLMNQDAWVQNDSIEKIIAVSKLHTEYGILSPFQMTSDLITIDKNFSTYVCSYQSNPNILSDFYNNSPKMVYPVPSVMAAHWLITRDCLRKVGGFSPSFPHYGEDLNYTRRAMFHSFKIGIVPSIRTVHDRATRTTSPKPEYMSYINAIDILSNPSDKGGSIIKQSLRLLHNCYAHTSFRPILYSIRLIMSFSSIKKNKNISKLNRCAFLTPNS